MTPTIAPGALAGHPKFGDWIRGNYASEENPIRDGMFVRVIRRTGRLNPGVWYELTDGKGEFWQFEAKDTTRIAAPAERDAAACTCAATPGAACSNCQRLPPLPKVSGYDKRTDGHYSAQAMRAYAADAITYSRNFASAKPDIGETEKQHILGLCDLLERAAPVANQPTKVRSYLQRMLDDELERIAWASQPDAGFQDIESQKASAYEFLCDFGPALASLLAAGEREAVAWRVCWKRETDAYPMFAIFDKLPHSTPGEDHCISVEPLYTTPPPEAAGEWRDIASAPRDGTAILVMRDIWPGTKSGRAEECNGHNTYVAEWWGGDGGNWICYMDAVIDPDCPIDPTHWQPLPTPPSLRTGEGDSGE